MLRLLLGLTLLIGFTLFVRHQYRMVMQKVTTPTTNPLFPGTAAESHRQKCTICGGTGKMPSFNLAYPNNGAQSSKPCARCNGSGWVENRLFVKDQKPKRPK